MAMLTDRPRQPPAPPEEPAERAGQPPAQSEELAEPTPSAPEAEPQDAPGPLWAGGHRIPSSQPGRRPPSRLLGGFYLYAPVAVVAIAVAAVLALSLALVLAPGEPAPATGAAKLVPADALLYVHVSTDTSRPATHRSTRLSRRLPDWPLIAATVTTRLDAILSGSSGAPVDFDTQVRPWLGKEAALAILDTNTASAGSLIVLDVRNRRRASAFLKTVGAAPDGSYHRVALRRQPSGTVLAFLDHYLVLGQQTSVQAAIDAEAGRGISLAASPVYQRAAAFEPADRSLDVYASANGLRRAVLPRGGILGAVGTLLDDPALNGATVSVSATGAGIRVLVHRALDPKLVKAAGPVLAGFTPSLADALPARSNLLLDAAGLARTAPRILTAAASAGVGGRVAPLLSKLGGALAAQGVSVRKVLSIFSGETAVATVPGLGGRGPAPVILTHTAHPARVRDLLAQLEVPLTQLFAPPSSGPGQAPEVSDASVAGATVHRLALAPGFELDYAVSHGLVVISTSTAAIGEVIRHSHALSDQPAYQRSLGDHPGQVTSLLFLDLRSLLRIGSRSGLIGGKPGSALWPDLQTIGALGLASSRTQDETTTQLRLQIR